MLNEPIKEINPDKFTIDDLYKFYDDAMAWTPPQMTMTSGMAGSGAMGTQINAADLIRQRLGKNLGTGKTVQTSQGVSRLNSTGITGKTGQTPKAKQVK